MAVSWDAIVIGSGIGGLAAAAALARHGRRVLVLERNARAGGLTQTFERHGAQFNVGVHYLGGMAENSPGRQALDALAGGRIQLAPIPGAYDRVHFPDFTLAFSPPRGALVQTLKAAFPAEGDGIDRYFDALDHGARALRIAFTAHNAPALIAKPLTWLKGGAMDRWVGRTTWEVVAECVQDPRLRAVLCAQWGDYGSRPSEGSFAMHATVMQHYLEGAWYPVGGPACFARELTATIEGAGGVVRTNAEVTAIGVHERRVTGVTLADGTTIEATCVISDAGIHNTLHMLPSLEVDYEWEDDALAIEPSIGYVGVYLILEGDIAAQGADTANTWIYDSWDVDALWTDPFKDRRAPVLFVCFPSLRDPAHEPGPRKRHTCEILAFVDWAAFAQWDHADDDGGMKPGTPAAVRDSSYIAFKSLIEENLLSQFRQHFPDLAPLVRHHEASTPISLATQVGAEHGAMYGLETTPRRFLSNALRPRTPIGGLLLAGQDAGSPGVTGAMMGGLMAAAHVEPRVFGLLRH